MITCHDCPMTRADYEREAAAIKMEFDRAMQRLEIEFNQSNCLHERTDDGGVFGDTCLDCGLYLNNGW